MSWWKNDIEGKGSPLTLDGVKKGMAYIMSEKYYNECVERERVRMGAQKLVIEAWDKKLISGEQADRYLSNIALNGFLALHPTDKNIDVFRSMNSTTTREESEHDRSIV